MKLDYCERIFMSNENINEELEVDINILYPKYDPIPWEVLFPDRIHEVEIPNFLYFKP